MGLKLCKKDIKANGGITLIALITTIIILLILAGVAIATLTGDNGLLQKATNAKETSINGEIEEEIRLAWNKVYMDSYLDSTTDKPTALFNELKKTGHTDENTKVSSKNGTTIIIKRFRGKDKILDISTGTVKELSVVAKAISDETVFDEKNKPITDEYGNTFIIPKGFKLSKDSAEVVTEGIVIEDATYANTIKSEFVWIPVSKDNKKIVGPAYLGADRIERKEATIKLSRYTFDDNGNPNDQGSNTISSHFSELLRGSSYGNVSAKTDVTSENGFIEKTKAAEGFWIGRYEARKSFSNKLTEVSTDSVYNYINQPKAAKEAQGMYDSNNDFESDLINSYAWDTATLFLQEFGSKNYSIQTSINTSGPNANGTVLDSNKDNPCNVYDMASNCFEWTTETCTGSNGPCVGRGGIYGNSDKYTIRRYSNSSSVLVGNGSFRPLLFIK